MARRNNRPQPHNFDWKDHPLMISAGSFAAGFALCITYFTQLYIPLQNVKMENELLKLREAKVKVEGMYLSLKKDNEVMSSEAKVTAKEISLLEDKKKNLEQQLLVAAQSNLFSIENPYPNGLGVIRIGMTIADIQKAYPGRIRISEEYRNIVNVGVEGTPLENITYYLTDKNSNATINHISFSLKYFGSKYPDDFLRKKMIENFGSPKLCLSSKVCMWEVGTIYSLYSMNFDSYEVMKRGQEPAYWDLEK